MLPSPEVAVNMLACLALPESVTLFHFFFGTILMAFLLKREAVKNFREGEFFRKE